MTFAAATLARMNLTAQQTAMALDVVAKAEAVKASGVILTQKALGQLVTDAGGDAGMVRVVECCTPFSMGF